MHRSQASLILTVLALPLLVGADFPEPREKESQRPYAPIEITRFIYDQPRPLRVWAVRIDLTSPAVSFETTAPGVFSTPHETAATTTLAFARQSGVQLAINASPFSPIRLTPGEAMDIQGLAAYQGIVYSRPAPNYGMLVIDRRGNPSIFPPPRTNDIPPDIQLGVGGFTVPLFGGRNRLAADAPGRMSSPYEPRTAVGLTQDRKTMWWLVIDGRQAGRSEGVTLYELAELGAGLGCHDLLNLDGGGSSTLVLQEPASKEYKVLNTPVGIKNVPGILRPNGNNLGLRIDPRQ